MESSRFVVVGAGLEDHPDHDTWQIIFIDTVVLDKSHVNQAPLLHCLRGGCDLLDKNAFEFLGPVAYVCRQTKRVYLLNRTIVSYNRLITFSTSKPDQHSHESPDTLSPNAIQAIVHTLRCYDVSHSTLAEIVSTAQLRDCAKFCPGPTTILQGDHLPVPESWHPNTPMLNNSASNTYFQVRG